MATRRKSAGQLALEYNLSMASDVDVIKSYGTSTESRRSIADLMVFFDVYPTTPKYDPRALTEMLRSITPEGIAKIGSADPCYEDDRGIILLPGRLIFQETLPGIRSKSPNRTQFLRRLFLTIYPDKESAIYRRTGVIIPKELRVGSIK